MKEIKDQKKEIKKLEKSNRNLKENLECKNLEYETEHVKRGNFEELYNSSKIELEGITKKHDSLKLDYNNLNVDRKNFEDLANMYNKQLNKQMVEAEGKLWEIKTIYEKERADLNAKISEERKNISNVLRIKDDEFTKILDLERKKNNYELKQSENQFKLELYSERSKSENLKIKFKEKLAINGSDIQYKDSIKQLINLLNNKNDEIMSLKINMSKMNQQMDILMVPNSNDPERSISEKTENLLYDHDDVTNQFHEGEYLVNLELPQIDGVSEKQDNISTNKFLKSNVIRRGSSSIRDKEKIKKLVNFAEDVTRYKSYSMNENETKEGPLFFKKNPEREPQNTEVTK